MNLPSNAKRPFTYAVFIEKVEDLIVRALKFEDDELSANHATFREWHHELSDLLDDIARKKYRVNTKFHGRSFTAHGTSISNLAAFDLAMEETMRELQLVVRKFEEFGDPHESEAPASLSTPVANVAAKDGSYGPKRPLPADTVGPELFMAPAPPAKADSEKVKPVPTELEVPTKGITGEWLFKHMDYSGWLKVGAIVATVFFAGQTFGSWPIWQHALEVMLGHWTLICP